MDAAASSVMQPRVDAQPQEIGESDADAYVAHQLRHDLESGRDGELPYGPYSREEASDAEGARTRWLKRRATPLDQPGWRRAWAVWENERIIGSVSLAGGELPTNLHRVDLGLGVERPFRRRRLGSTLMETALGWARARAHVDWVDLGVFVGNDVAIALYDRLGFQRVGTTKDLYRVDGVRIDNLQMTLHVGVP